MGAGKTSLARALSGAFGWRYVPEPTDVSDLVSDLLSDPHKYALEVQLHFFINKALQIQSLLDRNVSGIIVDRSLIEDKVIFGKYFYDMGYFDERSYALYEQVTDYFLSNVVPTDLYVFCRAPLAELENRIKARGRDFENHYPEGHLDRINERYGNWLKDQRPQSAISYLDTTSSDPRSTRVVSEIAEDIIKVLEGITKKPEQGSLFSESGLISKTDNLIHLELESVAAKQVALEGRSWPRLRSNRDRSTYPAVYIAAPFTDYATQMDQDTTSPKFIDAAPKHGVVPKGPYRNALVRFTSELSSLGIESFLPHRDLNGWGRKVVSPEEVARVCSQKVVDSDIFICILGNSPGAHYELGLALGMRKPTIIVTVDTVGESYLGSGITSEPDELLKIRIKDMSDLPAIAGNDHFRSFLEKHLARYLA